MVMMMVAMVPVIVTGKCRQRGAQQRHTEQYGNQ
jgi:hypothetical protein